MLFTTAVFVLLFLPVTLGGFFALRARPSAAAGWLLLASLFFYGWWMPRATLLLLASIGFNFWVGTRIVARVGEPTGGRVGKRWLALGIVVDLGLLGYFKYFNFVVDNLAGLLDTAPGFARVVLPLGISFFTFTQIAFLVDAWHGKVREASWLHYGLFVTYFPHLIAGPVLHHGQMMPQFAASQTYRWNGAHAAAGLVIFVIGLTKKIVFADGLSPYANAVFDPADAGLTPDAAEAWLAAVAYTLELYFDFSGYSDMAVGLSWLFNIRLPFNFDSPYRAGHISEFWRRWHISLSSFLRDYLYIPLGGNRQGPARRYLNLMATMVLGGLWHGAAWSFVLWGTLHGLYLVVHHGWRGLLGRARLQALSANAGYRLAAWALTMLAVVAAWVFFRATSFDGALRILHAMARLDMGDGTHALLWNAGLHLRTGAGLCIALAIVALWPVNSNRLGAWCLERFAGRRGPSVFAGTCALVLVLLLVLVNTTRSSTSAFIYFNF